MPTRFTLEMHDDKTATLEIVELNKGKRNTPLEALELSNREARQVVDVLRSAIGNIQTQRLTDPQYLD